MATVAHGIAGYEYGGLPPTGQVIGFFWSSGNGFDTSDLVAAAARSGDFGFNDKFTVAGNAKYAALSTVVAAGLTSARWEIRARYFFRPITRPSVTDYNVLAIGTGTGTPAFRLQMDTAGALRAVPSFCGNTTTAYEGATSLNAWYRVDLRIFGEGAGGQVGAGKSSEHEVIVYDESGAVVASFAEATPVGNNMPSIFPEQITCGQQAGYAGPTCTREIHHDDLWWKFVTTATDADALEWPLGTRILPFVPTANGATNQFTRGGPDSGANWSQVDERPVAVPSDNVSSATAGQIDVYQHAALAPSTDVVYHIRNIAWWFDSTTPQTLLIDGVEYDRITTTGTNALHGVADVAFANATPLSNAAFNALQFGVKKKSGGTTFTSAVNFLEVLAGPPANLPEVSFDADALAQVGLTWVEVTDAVDDVHTWANIALPDPASYHGGYKDHRIVSWGTLRRALSNIDGAYEGTAFSWVASDTDRFIRGLLASELTKWFFNRSIVVRTITDNLRRLLQTPKTIFRGVLRDWQPEPDGLFSFAAEDYLVTTFQIGTDEQSCPKRDIDVADFPTCPDDNKGKPVQVIYGEFSDRDQQVLVVPGNPGTPTTTGLQKPKNFTATVVGGAGSATYTYGVTALDNRNRQHTNFASRLDHAGETDAAYVTVTGAPDLDEMSEDRYVEMDWDEVPNAHHYRIYGRHKNGGTTLNLLDSARGPKAGTPERYNDGERSGRTEVDREKRDSHPPKSNNTVVSGNPGTPGSTITIDKGRGLVPTVYVGQRDIGGTMWHEFVVCGHAMKAVLGVYRAESQEVPPKPEPKPKPKPGGGLTVVNSHSKPIAIDIGPETDERVREIAPVPAPGGVRVADSEADTGGTLLVPTLGTGWAAAFGAPTYRDFNGRRYTVIYARNDIGEKAALDEQKLYLNVQGIEDVGDGTGTLLTSLIDQYLHALKNWLIGNYQSGAWLASPTFPDDVTLDQINADSFTTAKARSEERIAGGYVGCVHFGLEGDFISVREALARLNVSCDVNCGFNLKTQFMIAMQSENISLLGLSQTITQARDILKGTFSIQSLTSEFFNRVVFQYGYFPENSTWFFTTVVTDPESITASLETRSAPLRPLYFVRTTPVAFDIARRFLLRAKEVPRKVVWSMGMASLNFELGDISLVTHADGVGAGGYESAPIRIVRQDYDPQTYTVMVEGYDVGQFFSDAYILGDETVLPASWLTATVAQRKYGFLGDDVTKTFSDGARAKRVR